METEIIEENYTDDEKKNMCNGQEQVFRSVSFLNSSRCGRFVHMCVICEKW